VAGAVTRTTAVCRVAFSTSTGPSGYGPRNRGSVDFGRDTRTVAVTVQSAAVASGSLTVQIGLLPSGGRTSVAPPPAVPASPPVRAADTSAPGGKAICQSFAGPRSRTLAVVSTCDSSTRTATSVSATRDVSAGGAGVAVVGTSQVTSSVSVGPSG
jgi:hypothetical protein